MSKIKIYLFLFCFSFLPYSYASKLIIGTLSYDNVIAEENIFFNFEINLMKEICKRIQANCQFEMISFQQVSEKIQSKAIDLALGSIVITKDKRKNYLFSLPYQESQLQYITLSKSKFKNIQELNGKSIGVQLHCPSKNMALKHEGNTIQVSELPRHFNMFSALEQKKISAILTNYHQAKQWVNQKQVYKLLGSKFSVGEGYGIMTQLGRQDLMKQINQALVDMENDGTYLNIYNQYL